MTTRLTIAEPARLLFYTDGLIERRDESIDVSIASLGSRLAELRRTSLEGAADSLVHNATSSGDDDMAMLLVDFDPDGAQEHHAGGDR